jgi:hypothetical protein
MLVMTCGTMLALTSTSCSSSDAVIAGSVATCPGGVTVTRLPLAVTVKESAKVMRRRVISAPYHFRFTVKPGTYRILAPGDIPVTTQVTAGQTLRIRLKTKCHMVG